MGITIDPRTEPSADPLKGEDHLHQIEQPDRGHDLEQDKTTTELGRNPAAEPDDGESVE